MTAIKLDADQVLVDGDRTCSIDGCDGEYKGRGWCRKHYMRWLRHGDPLVVLPKGRFTGSPEERFWAKVDCSGDCWEWTGGTSDGYGAIRVDGLMAKAHRFAYEQLRGPIPDDLDIDHLCRNTRCVNPDHLEPVTRSENARRQAGGDTPDLRFRRIVALENINRAPAPQRLSTTPGQAASSTAVPARARSHSHHPRSAHRGDAGCVGVFPASTQPQSKGTP